MGPLLTMPVLDSHPALTNVQNKRKLICCAPVIILLAARLEYTLFFVEKAED